MRSSTALKHRHRSDKRYPRIPLRRFARELTELGGEESLRMGVIAAEWLGKKQKDGV